MARLTRTAAQIARNFVSIGFAAAALVALAASEAAAQKTPTPPASPTALMEDAIDLCAMFSGELGTAEDELINRGWTIEYSEANGPFIRELNASKIYPDGSDAYLFVLVESYPTGSIAYCSFDVQSIPFTPDINAIAEIYDVIGEIQTEGDATYGAWDQYNEGTWYYVLANTTPNYLFVQLTAVTSTEATTGTTTGVAK